MRIGCLQFAPQVGDIDNNLNRADAVLSRANPENLDLLVLPELAFTGYNFKSLQEISPFLEPKGSGISALWARTVALKHNCVVTVGYPEKVDVKPKWPTSPEYYNSVIVVNGDGETIGNYRKSFLYYTDETWALEGQEGFYGAYIPGLGTTSIGICMDINPYKFEAPWHAFEFAFHCLEVEANVVIMSMAWLTREDGRLFSRMPNEPDMDTVTYWISRLEPLIRAESREEIIVVFCNRTGIEDDAVYAGTSMVVGVKDGEVNVYGLLGRGEKDLLVVDTKAAPYAKLVYRPGDHDPTMTPVVEPASGSGDHTSKRSGQGASTKPPQAEPSPKSNANPKEEAGDNVAYKHRQLEEARHISQPRSPASQGSYSSHQSRSSKESQSSHRSRSSQKSQTSQRSRSSQRPHTTRPSHSTGKGMPVMGVTDDYPDVPLGLTKTGSHRSTMSVQGSVSSHTSSTSARSKSSSRARSSKDTAVSQERTYQREASRKGKLRSPPIQIPTRSMEVDTIPTPTAPSPTPLAVRPKLIIPKDAHKMPAKPHVPTPHPGVGGRSAKIYGGHVSVQQQHEIFTPTTAIDDMTPQSPNKFFWIPSASLLETPMEPRTWTPARADSPTLSMKMPAISQPYVRNTARVGTPVREPQLRSRYSVSPAPSSSTNKSRAETKSSSTEPQPITGRSFEPQALLPTASRNVDQSKSRDRSDSPFANRPDWAAIAERLEALSPHPDTVAANKIEPPTPRPGSSLARRIETNDQSSRAMPSRPSSPKSRNASRSRAANPIGVDDPLGDERQETTSRAVPDKKPIRGPSAMFRPDSRMSNVEPTHRSMSRAAHSRSNSASLGQMAPTATGPEKASGGYPQSRAASRGRLREHEPNDANRARDSSVRARRPSAPSFRFRSPAEFEAEMKLISPERSVEAYYGNVGTGDENEIIGEIIVRRSPSCVVHGRKAEGDSSQGGELDKPKSSSSHRVGEDSQDTSETTTSEAIEAEGTKSSTGKAEDSEDLPVQTSIESTQSSPTDCAPSVETPESSIGSPAPQYVFQPKTSQAIALLGEDESSILTSPLTAPFVNHLRVAKFGIHGADNDKIIRPQSALW